MKIKRANIQDLERLKEIGKATFTETFAADNTEENLSLYLKNGFSTEKLTQELTDNYSEFYFAEYEGKMIGYLKINFGPSQTESNVENAIEIERIYVLKEFQGKKIGQALYEKAITVAKEKNVDFVWLGVWEKNPKAISFYKKNGFEAFDSHIFNLGNDEQTDILMKLKLK